MRSHVSKPMPITVLDERQWRICAQEIRDMLEREKATIQVDAADATVTPIWLEVVEAGERCARTVTTR